MSCDKVTPWLRLSSFLGKGPRYLSAYAFWRAKRVLSSLGTEPRWPAAEELRAPGGNHAPGAVDAALVRTRFTSRRSPPPLCDWARRESVVRAVPEAQIERTVAAADALCERRFRYRGREVAFSGAIDWSHRPDGNLDWTWDLNRHHFFVVLGRAFWYTEDERYARAFVELFTDWMRTNPPGIEAPAWRSVFEAGARVANWCWAHALFLPSRAFGEREHLEFVRGLLGLGRFLHAHLERHAWNNHLLLEAKALATAGLLYPELPGATEWQRVGLRLLEAELVRQVLPDGVHSERSSLYHRIIASELLEHLVLLRLLGRGEKDRHYCLVLLKLVGMAMFQAAITRADGSVPLLGDSSIEDEHIRFDAALGARLLLEAPGIAAGATADEDLAWLFAALGEERRLNAPLARGLDRARESRAFPHGGYWILASSRAPEPLHLVFDCGPFGDPVVPGHGHADALSIDVAVGPSHVLVDPGMYSAHLGERWRNFFRGTAAHNTVVVDGKDQSLLSGLRRVYRPAPARHLAWATCAAFDLVAGEHTGYRRLHAPVTHRREIFFRKPRYWLVVDRLEGRGDHVYDLLFHLHPRQTPVLDPATLGVTVRDAAGRGIALLPLVTAGLTAAILAGVGGEEATGETTPQGWVAFISGQKEPAPVVRYRVAASTPLTVATVLWPLTPVAPEVPLLEALSPSEPGVVAARLLLAHGAEETVIAAPLAALPREGRQAGGLETNAVLAALSRGPRGEAEAGVVFRGTELRSRGERVVDLETPLGPGSFAFGLEATRLEVSTTTPLAGGSRLRFGAFAAKVDKVLIDGKEATCDRRWNEVVVNCDG